MERSVINIFFQNDINMTKAAGNIHSHSCKPPKENIKKIYLARHNILIIVYYVKSSLYIVEFEVPVLGFLNSNSPKRRKCFKNRPAKSPTHLYLPDGYSRNILYRTSRKGQYRAVIAGCWIKTNKCSNRKTRRKTYFYDGEGATNLGTGNDGK
ncbi:unnamed protein product [Mytilus edulis]|uniref:Uncharacterized protein n=1 Tax=Mytilus edulis TaxID=6550 RepID=A0A8S3UI36_MYTED|nr:unnamed protein product [Mytilus edulis]